MIFEVAHELRFQGLNPETGQWVEFSFAQLLRGEHLAYGRIVFWRQYTGRRDKNGKRVYHGDIAQAAMRNEFGSIQTDVRGVIAWNPDMLSFCTKVGDDFYAMGEHFEIVGDVVTTPHLIPK